MTLCALLAQEARDGGVWRPRRQQFLGPGGAGWPGVGLAPKSRLSGENLQLNDPQLNRLTTVGRH